MNKTLIAAILIAILIVIILFSQNKVKKTPDEPKSATSSTPDTNDFVVMNEIFLVDELDLSKRNTLRSFESNNLVAKTVKLPRHVDRPVTLQISSTSFEEPIPNLPDRVTSISVYNTDQFTWTTFWTELLASPDLYNLSIGQVSAITPFIDVPDITLRDFNSPAIRKAPLEIRIDSVHNIKSIGNILIPSSYGIDSGSRTILISSCNNLETAGNITVEMPTGSLNILMEFNNVLASIGNLSISSAGSISVNYNPNLTNIGTITFPIQTTAPSLYFTNNNLSSAVISQMLIDVDASGVTNGTLLFDSNPGSAYASLTAPGQIAWNPSLSSLSR